MGADALGVGRGCRMKVRGRRYMHRICIGKISDWVVINMILRGGEVQA